MAAFDSNDCKMHVEKQLLRAVFYLTCQTRARRRRSHERAVYGTGAGVDHGSGRSGLGKRRAGGSLKGQNRNW